MTVTGMVSDFIAIPGLLDSGVGQSRDRVSLPYPTIMALLSLIRCQWDASRNWAYVRFNRRACGLVLS